MKKVLIGVGIGCGVLVLLGMVGLAAGGVWVSKKAGDFAASAEEFRQLDDRFSALNQRFPFTPPADGELLELEAARLEAWLEVNEQSRDTAAELEAVYGDASKTRDQIDGASTGAVIAVMEQTKRVAGAVLDVRAKLLTRLEQARMSPAEYVAITQAVITTAAADHVERARDEMAKLGASMESSRRELEAKLADPSTPAAEREALQEALERFNQGQDEMARMESGRLSGAQARIQAANAALVKGLEERVEAQQQTALMMLTIASGGHGSGALGPPAP